MPVIAEDLVGGPRVAHGESGAMERDLVQLVSQAPPSAFPAQPFQPVAQSTRDRLCLCFSGSSRQLLGKPLGFRIANVESHYHVSLTIYTVSQLPEAT